MIIYFHIPFCDSKCHYCAFNSYTNLHQYKNKYMVSLFEQLKNDIKKYKILHNSVKTLFFGGGTPSTIDAKNYKIIFDFLSPYLIDNCEITFEANPNSATLKWLKEIYLLGANRISFGVQSFDNKKLNFLGRSHNNIQALKAIDNANIVGFKNISIDIIYDTMYDTPQFLESEFNIIKDLSINHISTYSLIIEENTPFEQLKESNMAYENSHELVSKHIQNLNFEQYEVSNYGTYKCKHNINYWNYNEYLGIGSGAVGRIGNSRTMPYCDVKKYINNPNFKDIEKLSKNNIETEKILLGLRSFVGFEKSILNNEESKKLDILLKEKKLYLDINKVKNKDYFIADEIALFLLNNRRF